MRTQVVFTSNSSSLISPVRKTMRENTYYVATVLAYGTWGSGTLAFYLSPDGGTTKIPITSSPGGTGVSFTANGMFVFTSGNPSRNTDTLQLWATMSGATSPSITVNVDDNNQ